MKQKQRILLGTISMVFGFLTLATIAHAREEATCTFTIQEDPSPNFKADAFSETEDVSRGCPAVEGILKANRAFMQAWAAGNAAGVAALYTEDAMLMAPNAPAYEGRAKIQNIIDSIIQSGITRNILTTLEVEVKERTAWERGQYTLVVGDGSIVDRGKYVVIWKRVQHQWMFYRDIFNSDLP